jgi:hypothetical protein
VQSVIDKHIREKAAIQSSKVKLKTGKKHLTFKNAKNVYQWFKRYPGATICLVLFVDISGVGFVEQTIHKPILVL